MNYRMFSLGAMALALFLVSATAVTAKDAEEATHDGKVVSITSSKLVMTNKGNTDGKEHSHMLSADTKVTLDGKACKAEDLKAGTKVRVTTQSADAKVVINVEAIDKNETFANTTDGMVVTVTTNKLVMSNKDGKEFSRSVSADAKLTLDGKACKVGALKPGMRIRVTTKKSATGAVIEIEALDKNATFA